MSMHEQNLGFSDAMAMAKKLIGPLRHLGIEPKDRVGLEADLSPHGVGLLLACMDLGLSVAICPMREPKLVVSAWLKSLKVSTLLTSGHSKFAGASRRTIGIDDLLKISIDEDLSFAVSNNFSSIIRTSGSTAVPKSAIISSSAHLASARSVIDRFDFKPGDVWALNLPLYHVSGLSILCRFILARASIFIASSHSDLRTALEQKKISHLSLVPSQLKRLIDEDVDLGYLKAIVIGGDSLPADVRDRSLGLGLPLFETYGLTETASMIYVRASAQSSGLLPHAQMRIAEDGEILVAGQSLFDGYVADDGSIDESKIDRRGFFATGDLGVLSKDELRVSGRKHNRMIVGGENIQAEEIEAVLDRHPLIIKSAVIAIADERYGARPVAFVDMVADIEEDLLKDFLRDKLAPYKWPKSFIAWPKDAPEGAKKPRRWLAENLESGQICHSQRHQVQ